MTIRVGLTLSPSEDLRAAALPLFEDELVDAIEWPIDMGFGGVPDWCEALLSFFGEEDRLVAHGVELSLLTVGQARRRARWLADAEEAFATYRFAHLTEHMGFMTAGAVIGGTPLPHPFTESAVAVGVRRLSELRRRFAVDVGLENLALALGPSDVDAQPDFIEAMLDPVGGFLLLDLHNLLCQAENFGRDPTELLLRYPLHRVREIHLAGGTHFLPTEGPALRRDDHERPVPDACLSLLEVALSRCPELRWIFIEHADNALRDVRDVAAFRATFRMVRGLVESAGPASAPTWTPSIAALPDEGEVALDEAQGRFLETLDDAPDAAAAARALSALPAWGGWASGFDPRALELAHHLLERWGERRDDPPPGEMRVAALESVGRVAWRRRAVPEPGPGQARLQVLACGLCGTDVQLWRGALGAPLPLVLGHETVGVVDAVGEGVALSLGARVGVPWAQASCGACDACRGGHPRFCERLVTWLDRGGGFADYALAEAAACVPLPLEADPAVLAPLLCAGHTALGAIRRAQLRAGERVAVVGIGGVGHIALGLAAAEGAEVFALTDNPTKTADALALGAVEVLSGAGPLDALARAGGADVILSTTPSLDLEPAIRALRPEGRVVVVGAAPGSVPVTPLALVEKGGSLVGATSGSREDLVSLVALFERGAVRPRVERYPLGQLRRALHRLEDRRVRYRAVMVP
ncbi:MAG: DUF692 family protein [Sandaracinaceae bacterium]|nr:DUF692 family protein [Sandaracinaceae bacterium]